MRLALQNLEQRINLTTCIFEKSLSKFILIDQLTKTFSLYKFQHMQKQLILRTFFLGASILCSWFLSGCAAIKAPEYPEIIYNHRQPLISVTYEYGEIKIQLPLDYPRDKPGTISFQVFSRGDTIRPMISILQPATDNFIAYLPQGVLDVDQESNYIKITPLDPNFRIYMIPFKGITYGAIILPPLKIKPWPLVVNGNVFLNRNDSTLVGVDVSIRKYGQLIKETKTNKNGKYKLTIPGDYKEDENLQLVAGHNLVFKLFKEKLDLSRSRVLTKEIGIGPSKALKEPLYLANKSNVHFRENPDIGSRTLFLLEEGETISVKRVTPGEYYGTIEVELDGKKNILFDGWVYRSDLKLLQFNNIFTRGAKVYKGTKDEDPL